MNNKNRIRLFHAKLSIDGIKEVFSIAFENKCHCYTDLKLSLNKSRAYFKS